MATKPLRLDFAAELAVGKANSLGNTLKIVKIVESDPKNYPHLLKLLLHKDSLVAMRAMNATKRLMRAEKEFFDSQKESSRLCRFGKPGSKRSLCILPGKRKVVR